MPLVLQQDWLGRRVSVRRVVERAPDGRLLLGDVVGRLAGLDAQTAVLDTRTGLVEVPVALVTAARVVPPSTADELALQAVAARGWPAAATEELDGWLLRADPGGSARANSVATPRQLRMPFDEALQRVRGFYAAHGQPAVFQIPTEARRLLGAELAERGWLAGGLTTVLVAEFASPAAAASPASRAAAAEVTIAGAPDAEWLAMPINAAGDAGDPAARAALLTRHPDTAFAAVRVDGALAAIGRATVEGEWVGVTTVEVGEAFRRRGLGRAVTVALQEWGRTYGAARTYVQVRADNDSALALYDRLGYRQHHDYHYLSEPS